MQSPHSYGAAAIKRVRPRWELADVLHLHGEAFLRSHPQPLHHLKIMRAISACRTPVLGGHVVCCGNCGFQKQAYNSCRNRHCPKCQSLVKAKWLEARTAELLPVGYFHVVFTLPHALNPIILCNKALMLKFLFDATAKTLGQFARDPKRGLGGKLGFIAVLHSWDQKLMDHFHIHCLIPAGVLSKDGQRWIHARTDFLFPVKALAQVFRGKYIALLKNAFIKQQLIFPGRTASSGTSAGFSEVIAQLYQKNWVVYCKPPFGGPRKVLDYLARYTHRVAISNHRIKAINDHGVTFSYRDRRDGDKTKVMTVAPHEFIRRFLLHAIPTSFMRIRHFGFLANRSKKHDLQLCRELLGLPIPLPDTPPISNQERLRELTCRVPPTQTPLRPTYLDPGSAPSARSYYSLFLISSIFGPRIRPFNL
ncbi:MAG: IS91 family transposase [Elusimicrobia bacterium]|nr:MAG: IS91 family transposase [Elusimicrobiota bacterium]